MTKKRDEKLGVELGPDEGEPRKEFGGPPRMVPPVDRETPVAPPDPPVTAPQAIEIVEQVIAPMRMQLNDLHELFMGGTLPDGRKVPGFGKAMHDTNGHLSSIALTASATHAAITGDQQREPLAKLIAAEVANKMIGMFEGVLAGIFTRLEALEEAKQHAGPNGTVPPSGE